MRFHLNDRFDAPVDDVLAADLDPAYQDRLTALPNVAERRVTELERRDDGSIRRVVRYRFGGSLPGAVEKAIGTPTVTWDEVGEFDPSTRTWRAAILPHVFRGRFEGRAAVRYEPDGDATRRAIEAEVSVKVPIVGRRVEQAIGDGLQETMSAEAEILAGFLAEIRGAV